MAIYKPLQLLIDSLSYDLVIQLRNLDDATRKRLVGNASEAEWFARNLLGNLAGMAAPDVVFKMLAAVKGPAGVDDAQAAIASIENSGAGAGARLQ